MPLRTERIRALERVRAFLGGGERVDFDLDDWDSAYLFVTRSLERFRYHRIGKAENTDRRWRMARTHAHP